jgi:hypothetical protein
MLNMIRLFFKVSLFHSSQWIEVSSQLHAAAALHPVKEVPVSFDKVLCGPDRVQ